MPAGTATSKKPTIISSDVWSPQRRPVRIGIVRIVPRIIVPGDRLQRCPGFQRYAARAKLITQLPVKVIIHQQQRLDRCHRHAQCRIRNACRAGACAGNKLSSVASLRQRAVNFHAKIVCARRNYKRMIVQLQRDHPLLCRRLRENQAYAGLVACRAVRSSCNASGKPDPIPPAQTSPCPPATDRRTAPAHRPEAGRWSFRARRCRSCGSVQHRCRERYAHRRMAQPVRIWRANVDHRVMHMRRTRRPHLDHLHPFIFGEVRRHNFVCVFDRRHAPESCTGSGIVTTTSGCGIFQPPAHCRGGGRVVRIAGAAFRHSAQITMVLISFGCSARDHSQNVRIADRRTMAASFSFPPLQRFSSPRAGFARR